MRGAHPPDNNNTPDAQNQATLALLLHQTSLERDDARVQRDDWKLRAERAESLLRRLAPDDPLLSANSASPPGDSANSARNTAALLLSTQELLEHTQSALRNAESRFRSIYEAWDGYEKWQIECERRSADSRVGLRPYIASLCGHHDPPEQPQQPAPSSAPLRASRHAAPPALATFPLPPPPAIHPNRVRPRAGSLESDRERKRSKSDRERVSEEPRAVYVSRQVDPSQSNLRNARGRSPPVHTHHLPVPSLVTGRTQQQQQASPPQNQASASQQNQNTLPPIHPQRVSYSAEPASAASASFDPTDPSAIQSQQQYNTYTHHGLSREQTLHFKHHPSSAQPSSEMALNREKKRESTRGKRARAYYDSVSNKSMAPIDDAASDSGNSIDEMILEASSSQPPGANTTGSSSSTTTVNNYNPTGSGNPNTSYPRSYSRSSTHGTDQGSGPMNIDPPSQQQQQQQVFGSSSSNASTSTNHIFATPLLGAPHKKSRSGPTREVDEGGARQSQMSPPGSQVIHPATNALGQRTCRQCGLVGRYKEGKCVEKWGPGPLGPGTVCDKCRKKMKRVERRGQVDAGHSTNPIPHPLPPSTIASKMYAPNRVLSPKLAPHQPQRGRAGSSPDIRSGLEPREEYKNSHSMSFSPPERGTTTARGYEFPSTSTGLESSSRLRLQPHREEEVEDPPKPLAGLASGPAPISTSTREMQRRMDLKQGSQPATPSPHSSHLDAQSQVTGDNEADIDADGDVDAEVETDADADAEGEADRDPEREREQETETMDLHTRPIGKKSPSEQNGHRNNNGYKTDAAEDKGRSNGNSATPRVNVQEDEMDTDK